MAALSGAFPQGRPASPRRVRHSRQERERQPEGRNPGGHARIGFAFEPGTWSGEPANTEPHKHSEIVWADPTALPPDTVGYTAAIITAVERGVSFTLNGW
jgi:hypothetical protein